MKKVLGVAGIIGIILFFLLAVFRVISWYFFWYIAAGIAVFAWWVLPKMK